MDDSKFCDLKTNAVELRMPYEHAIPAAGSMNPRHCEFAIDDGLGLRIRAVYLGHMESAYLDL